MKIRKAVSSDCGPLARLTVQAMEELAFTFVGTDKLSVAWDAFEHLCGSSGNLYSYENAIVLEDDKSIAGAISGYDGKRLRSLRKPVVAYLREHYGFEGLLEDETQAGEFYIDTVSVFPDRQGLGYGKMLIESFVSIAKQERFEHIGLLVDVENPLAKKLYEKLGFHKVGEKTLFGGFYDHLQLPL